MRRKGTTSRLRQKLTLQEETQTADGAGGYTRSWTDVCELWVEVTPLNGREKIIALQKETSVTHRLTLRFKEGIAESQRLVSSNDHYYVRYILAQPGDELMALMTERLAGQ